MSILFKMASGRIENESETKRPGKGDECLYVPKSWSSFFMRDLVLRCLRRPIAGWGGAQNVCRRGLAKANVAALLHSMLARRSMRCFGGEVGKEVKVEHVKTAGHKVYQHLSGTLADHCGESVYVL